MLNALFASIRGQTRTSHVQADEMGREQYDIFSARMNGIEDNVRHGW